jgi:DNA (cytosine-5)-methyltransferase 1
LKTVTTGNHHYLVTPFITEHANASTQRNMPIDESLRTQCAQVKGGHFALVAAFLAKHYGGKETSGWPPSKPISTVTTQDHHAVVAAHLLNLKGSDRRHRPLNTPAPTITACGTHQALVAALLAPYYGQGSGMTGRDLADPAPTITTKNRLQLVTVTIDGESYVLTDIGMRMLTPRELYRAQGFPDSYKIDIEIDGERLSKAAQVRMCGNSVCPPIARAIVAANLVEADQSAAA